MQAPDLNDCVVQLKEIEIVFLYTSAESLCSLFFICCFQIPSSLIPIFYGVSNFINTVSLKTALSNIKAVKSKMECNVIVKCGFNLGISNITKWFPAFDDCFSLLFQYTNPMADIINCQTGASNNINYKCTPIKCSITRPYCVTTG